MTICGCQSTTENASRGTSTDPDIPDRSRERIRLSNDPYAELQELLERALVSSPDSAARLYARSVRIAIELEDTEYLESILQKFPLALLDDVTKTDVHLFSLQYRITNGMFKGLRQTIEEVQTYNRDQRDQLFRISAQLYQIEQRYADTANALMQITPDEETIQTLNDEIWKNCTRASPAELREQLVTNGSAYANAWWLLANSMNESFSLVEEQRALREWLQKNPSHAAAAFLPTSLQQLAMASVPPRTIALLLPLSGRLGSAGKAIREGFLSAYYHSGYPHSILIYDTFEQDIRTLYEQAATDQVDIIVGPLEKNNLEMLTNYPGRTIPVLGLNVLRDNLSNRPPGTQNAILLQFALAVEDEAKSVAQRVKRAGLSNIALVSSTDGWSERAAQEFKRSLTPDQKIVAELLLNDVKSTTGKLGDALSVSDSIKRNSELQKVTGSSFELTPRSRKDIDVIIAMVDGLKASALNSALEYHFTDDLPVFAVSQVTQRLPESKLGQLNDIEFTEIPWRLEDSSMRKIMATHFGMASRTVDPLNAFGVDAYRLLDRLELMLSTQAQSLRGGTGKLSLDDENKVIRELYWAKIQSGKIVYAN